MDTAPENVEDGEDGMHAWWQLSEAEQAALAPFDPHPTPPGTEIALVHSDGFVEFVTP